MEPYLYLLPTAVVVAAVVVYPLIYTVGLSLFDVNLLQLARARFVGLGNYADMLGSGTFWHSLGVTAAYTFATVAVSLMLGLGTALLLTREFRFRTLARAAIILPWATPALPAYMSIHWFLNGQWGMLNNVLYLLTGIDGPVYLNSRWLGLAANIGAYIWKNLPFWTLILLSGRMAIPQELYEAAAVDGASGLRRLTHVTLPLMANLYIVCVLLDTVFALGDFNATYFVSGGGPAMSTEVLATLGIRYAYTVSLPRLGVAEVMTALPVLIPLIFILMRKLRMSEGQL